MRASNVDCRKTKCDNEGKKMFMNVEAINFYRKPSHPAATAVTIWWSSDRMHCLNLHQFTVFLFITTIFCWMLRLKIRNFPIEVTNLRVGICIFNTLTKNTSKISFV